MPLNRKVTEVTGALPRKQAEQAMIALKARKSALLTWRQVAEGIGDFNPAYLFMVAFGRKHPSRRLLRALGIVKPEKRDGIRVRMSADEAREIVERSIVPVNVKNRIRYQMGAK